MKISFTGFFLFLEEDHYVSKDFLSVLHLIETEKTIKYPKCDMINLGNYVKSNNYNNTEVSKLHYNFTLSLGYEKKKQVTVLWDDFK